MFQAKKPIHEFNNIHRFPECQHWERRQRPASPAPRLPGEEAEGSRRQCVQGHAAGMEQGWHQPSASKSKCRVFFQGHLYFTLAPPSTHLSGYEFAAFRPSCCLDHCSSRGWSGLQGWLEGRGEGVDVVWGKLGTSCVHSECPFHESSLARAPRDP